MAIVEEKIGSVLVEIINYDRGSLKEAKELKEIFAKRIDEGYKKIIVDISQCDYIDSTFLGALVSGLKSTVKNGGDLKLVGLSPVVRSMFELTRMFRVFETFTELQDAVKSFTR